MISQEIKDALSIQELKALCEHFYNAGKKKANDFETEFNSLMEGKYKKAIEQTALEIKWQEMQADIQKHMDEWDFEQQKKAGQAIEDLSKIFITH